MPDDTRDQRHDKYRLFVWIVASVVLLDRVTKWVVQETIDLNAQIEVVGNVVRLTYLHNPGAAFGIHVGDYSRVVFLSLSIVAIVVLSFMYRATRADQRVRIASIALVIAGALGNLVDRLSSAQGVIDFIDLGIGTLRWPVFNVADMAVTTGALLLVFTFPREDRQGASGG